MNRAYSLKKNREFQHVYRSGKSCATRIMVLVFSRTRRETLRVGFSVSKKVGNSVVRNRAKRRMRECFRQHMDEIARGYQFIFIAREGMAAASYAQIEKAMLYLLDKMRLLKRDVSQ